MERKNIIQKLVKEGMSEKTLANFSDKQIALLADRMLSEEMKKGSVVMPKSTATPNDIDRFTKAGQNVELREKLYGNQTKLDKNKNGELDSNDFELIRKDNDESYDMDEEDMSSNSPKKISARYEFLKDLQNDPDFIEFKKNSMDNTDDENLFEAKKKPSSGLTKEKKSEVVKKAKAGKDIGNKGKTFKDIEAKAKASGVKNPKAVAGAAMWKNIKREPKKGVTQKNESAEVKQWLNNIVESEYHPFTSKNEILSLIKSKLNK